MPNPTKEDKSRLVQTEEAWMAYVKHELAKHGTDVWFDKTDMTLLKAGFVFGYSAARGWIETE